MKRAYTIAVIVAAIALLALPVFAGDLPDPALTPGVVNPAVTQANIRATICVSGWTATIRPPVSYTNKMKRQQMAALHLAGPTSAYEEDHRLPLEIGGHPTDPKNLWPEHWAEPWGAHAKDRLENLVHRKICGGQMSLAQGQAIFLGDWIAAYQKYIPGR